MRKASLIVILIFSLVWAGCGETDIGTATRAGIDAVRAITLDDEDVKRLAEQVSRQYDSQHTVAGPQDPYAKRLRRLTADYGQYDGRTFDFKVYLSPQVNAFAMADGTIRIYSGLMDRMNDGELLFVIGHEMGHVIEDHIKRKIRLAYASSAVRKAIASQQGEAGEIARSVLGALAENLVNAQFSQQEERNADDFGLMFLKKEGFDTEPAVSALMKLAALGGGHSLLASHPAPESRAQRLQAGVQAPPAESPSLLKRIVVWLQGLWPFGSDEKARFDDEKKVRNDMVHQIKPRFSRFATGSGMYAYSHKLPGMD